MPTILALQAQRLHGRARRSRRRRTAALTPQADRIQSYGIDLARRPHRRPRPGVGGGRGRPADPALAHLRRRAAHPRHRRPGHQPRPHREGQPAEHAGVRDAPRQRARRSKARKVSIVTLDNAGRLDRHDQRRRRGDRAGAAAARPEALVRDEVRVPGDGREGRRRSPTSAATGTKASSPWEFGISYRLRRAALAAARHGVRRSRRLPPRRGGPLQGDPPPRHGHRHQGAGRRHAGLRQRPRQPGSRGRSARGEAVGVGLGRVDAHAAGRRRARQLLGADAAAPVQDATKKPSTELVRRAERRRTRSRARPSGRAAARFDQRRLPRRRLPPAGLPRRRDAHQRDAVRRHDARPAPSPRATCSAPR